MTERMPEEAQRIRKQSAIQRIRRRVAERDPARVLALEKRLLAAATASLVLALVLWCSAVGTDYWFHVVPEAGAPIFLNRSNAFFVRSHSGLWTICKFVHLNGSTEGPEVRICHNHRLFPSDEFIQKNTEVDRTILDYTRTESAFAIITFCLIVMGFGFGLYTFREPRYTFKRLAAAVHLIGAASSLVVIEVVANSVAYEERHLTDRHPKGAIWHFGYSCALAWIVFALLLVCGIVFLLCSRKKKGAAGEGDDGPNILGRA